MILIKTRFNLRGNFSDKVLRRFLSTSTVDTFNAGQEAKMRQVAEGVKKNMEDGIKELQTTYGTENAHVLFMTDFYKGRADNRKNYVLEKTQGDIEGAIGHRFLIPAFALSCSDPRYSGAPSVQAKTAVFFAHAFRSGGLPSQLFSQAAATLTMVPGADIALILAIMHLVNTPISKAVSERLGTSVRRSGNRPLIEAGQHISRVPVSISVDEWPMPSKITDSKQLLAMNELHRAEDPVLPYEVTPIFSQARVLLPLHDLLLVTSMTILESQWAAFYATGDKRYIRRVAEIASDWSECSDLVPDSVSFLLNVEAKLPQEIAPDAATCSSAGSPETAALESARSARAHVSRAAAWSLLTHARRHPRVIETVAEECGKLSLFISDIRDESDIKDSGLSETIARRRVEILPALIHLMARSKIDRDVNSVFKLSSPSTFPPKSISTA
jgi:hypothetical protein